MKMLLVDLEPLLLHTLSLHFGILFGSWKCSVLEFVPTLGHCRTVPSVDILTSSNAVQNICTV